METNKQIATAAQSIALIQPQQLCKQLFQINFLVAFPLADSAIEDWAETIKRLSPETTTDQLQEVIDKFMTNRCHWKEKQGIQNIFRGIDLLKIGPKEYYCEEKKMKYRIFGSIEGGNRRLIYENDKEF